MASGTATHAATVEPKVTMMDGFETRRTHGSVQSAGTGDASSADQIGGGYHVHREYSWIREITREDGTTWELDPAPMDWDTTLEAEQEDSLPRARIPQEGIQELPGRQGARTPEEWTLLGPNQGTGPGSKPVNTDL